MVTVFIASPYGDDERLDIQRQRVYRQMAAADTLIENGFCPIVPLYTHFQNMAYKRERKIWLAIAREKLKRSDIVLRLSGSSPGADEEVALSKYMNKPVFYNIQDLLDVYVGECKSFESDHADDY